MVQDNEAETGRLNPGRLLLRIREWLYFYNTLFDYIRENRIIEFLSCFPGGFYKLPALPVKDVMKQIPPFPASFAGVSLTIFFLDNPLAELTAGVWSLVLPHWDVGLSLRYVILL